jgi:membrane-bound lytic murein transglycosylase B
VKLRRISVAAVMAGALVVSTVAGQPQGGPAAQIDRAAFAEWVEGARAEALTRGISQQTVDLALVNLEPVEKVLERDRTQAEFALSIEAYLKRRLTPGTVKIARQEAARHRVLLKKVGTAYGVDPRVIVAIWGLESNFGRFAGVRPTVPVLATLAWEGRRGEFFRQQLFDALTIVDRGDIEFDRLKGSWAGALGQVQFMPSSYLKWAVDFDGDGDRDVWSSPPDIFGSIGNYLREHGWSEGRWGYSAKVQEEARGRVATVPLRETGCRAVRGLSQPRALKDWRTLGVRRSSGQPVPASPREASLLEIDDRRYLVTANYEALLAYNCAHTYALSVALLGDRIPAF